MADIVNNKTGGNVTVITTSNTNLAVTAFATSNNETVEAVTINKIAYSTSSNITIARGNTNVLVLTGNGFWPLSSYGLTVPENPTANVVVTFGDVNSSLILELSKKSSYVSNDYSNGTPNS